MEFKWGININKKKQSFKRSRLHTWIFLINIVWWYLLVMYLWNNDDCNICLTCCLSHLTNLLMIVTGMLEIKCQTYGLRSISQPVYMYHIYKNFSQGEYCLSCRHSDILYLGRELYHSLHNHTKYSKNTFSWNIKSLLFSHLS
jgi:hypothetical protein